MTINNKSSKSNKSSTNNTNDTINKLSSFINIENKYHKKYVIISLIVIIVIIIILILYLCIKYKYIEVFTSNSTESTESTDSTESTESTDSSYNLPRKIWIYLDTEELPKDILLITNNNKKILQGWDITVLNKINLKDYLDINTFSKKYDALLLQHKLDYIRLKILNKYGGIWMDASIIINSKEEFENLYNQTLNNKIELTAFTLLEKDPSYTYHQYIENCFLIAPLNSNIVALWLEEFEKAINMGFDEYNKYIVNVLHVKLCSKIINSAIYLTQHKALQVVLQNRITHPNVPKMLLLKSEDTMFKLGYDCNWDEQCMTYNFNNNKEIKKIPFLKLVGIVRKYDLDYEKYFANDAINPINTIGTSDTSDTSYILPRKIWIYWDSEELPKDISLIIDNNKKKLPDWDIKVLNKNNLKQYLDIYAFPKTYDTLSLQHKADYIRLKLLSKYGGIWMDASIIINSKEEIENLYKQTLNNKIELTAFTLLEKDESYTYHQNIENWFLIAPLKSNIVALWLEEFEKAINIGFDDYKKYIKDDLQVKICDNINNFGIYLTQHSALQVVLQKRIIHPNVPKILLFKAEDSMLKLSVNCKWQKDCIKTNFTDIEKTKEIPYIKFTRFEREYGLDFDKYFS